MFKVLLSFSAILILSTAVVFTTSEEPIYGIGCKLESELWGSEDGTKFYFCVGENKSLEQFCPPNTFFVKNSTVTGCIPLDAVGGNCIDHRKLQPCKGIYLNQPQPHPDPTKFYVCLPGTLEPVALKCNEGAFLHQDGWLGCFNWTHWRSVRGCHLSE